MEKVIVEILYSGKNFGAHMPILSGCVATGSTLKEVKDNIRDAIQLHIEGSLEDGDPIPDVFKGEYQLIYKLSPEALLNAYSDIFTKAALSRITGINERQLWHYAAGMRKPRPTQIRKIEEGLHHLADELRAIAL
ncbi:MAG: type II toxin-antitoxin system HicB family antitoxin [Oscillibacter sp.]|nr:type II toxin-antitoxin system HicB family antitoxin [Oscillibacter sp.]